MSQEALEECPICGSFIESDALSIHVNLHFNDSGAGAGEGHVACSHCGAQVLISELDSHEEAHRSATAKRPSCLAGARNAPTPALIAVATYALC